MHGRQPTLVIRLCGPGSSRKFGLLAESSGRNYGFCTFRVDVHQGSSIMRALRDRGHSDCGSVYSAVPAVKCNVLSYTLEATTACAIATTKVEVSLPKLLSLRGFSEFRRPGV